MTRHALAVLALLVTVSACGKKTEGDAAEGPDAVAAGDSIPKVPTIAMLATGNAVDTATKMVSAESEFRPTDTIFVAVGGTHTAEGAKVSLMLMQGTNHVGSAEGVLPALGADGFARIALFFAPAKPWAVGEYQISSTLDGAAQSTAMLKVVAPK